MPLQTLAFSAVTNPIDRDITSPDRFVVTLPDGWQHPDRAGRETVHGRSFRHYRVALHESRIVLYHLGAPVTAAVKRSVHLRWPWERHFLDLPTGVGKSLVAYLECAAGTRTRSTVLGIAGRLAYFGEFITTLDPALITLAGLDGNATSSPTSPRSPRPGTRTPARRRCRAIDRRSRILTVGRMIADITEWGWAEAPARRLVFPRDVPRLPRPLPRYLPVDADRRLTAALRSVRATGWPPTRCCCPGPPACGSGNCSTWNWTACTRSPARGPG